MFQSRHTRHAQRNLLSLDLVNVTVPSEHATLEFLAIFIPQLGSLTI